MKTVAEPKWTIVSSTGRPASRWVGERWDFFDDRPEAEIVFRQLLEQGGAPTLRQYHRPTDLIHMACDQWARVLRQLREV